MPDGQDTPHLDPALFYLYNPGVTCWRKEIHEKAKTKIEIESKNKKRSDSNAYSIRK